MIRQAVLVIVGILIGVIAGYYLAARQRPRQLVVDARTSTVMQQGGAVREGAPERLTSPELDGVSIPGGI